MPTMSKSPTLGRMLRVALLLSLLGVGAAAQTADTPPKSPPSKSTVAPIEVRVEKTKEKRDARRREVIVFDKLREGCPLWRFEMSSDANGRIIFQVNEPVEPDIVRRDVQRDKEFEMILGDKTCRFRIRIEPSE
jgi:hypothetical protein